MRSPRVVTLTTDIGSAYAAQMKGVLLERLPPGHIVDVTHDLSAHRIEEAAFLLAHIGPAFPPGTVHVAVVDPGVGGARAPIAVRCRDGSLLVGPDNGVLAPLAAQLGVAETVRLEPHRFPREREVSATFEGRDVFAPAAALLATGRSIRSLGPSWELTPFTLPEAERGAGAVRGTVLHVDRFGNAITNIPTEWWPVPSELRARLRGRSRLLLCRRTYSDLPRGSLGLIGSSFGTLEVALREGRASDALHLRVGSGVVLRAVSSPRDRAGRPPRRAGHRQRAASTRRSRAYGK